MWEAQGLISGPNCTVLGSHLFSAPYFLVPVCEIRSRGRSEAPNFSRGPRTPESVGPAPRQNACAHLLRRAVCPSCYLWGGGGCRRASGRTIPEPRRVGPGPSASGPGAAERAPSYVPRPLLSPVRAHRGACKTLPCGAGSCKGPCDRQARTPSEPHPSTQQCLPVFPKVWAEEPLRVHLLGLP